jgi:hypothetical protein
MIDRPYTLTGDSKVERGVQAVVARAARPASIPSRRCATSKASCYGRLSMACNWRSTSPNRASSSP